MAGVFKSINLVGKDSFSRALGPAHNQLIKNWDSDLEIRLNKHSTARRFTTLLLLTSPETTPHLSSEKTAAVAGIHLNVGHTRLYSQKMPRKRVEWKGRNDQE